MLTMVFGHMNGTLALLALALGYIVCSLAKKEKGLLKTTGYFIGIAIVVISSVLILSKLIWTTKMCAKVCAMKHLNMPVSALPKK